MKKFTTAIAVLAATLVLGAPFTAQAQTDQQMDAKFNMPHYMAMANKDGMLMKADVMKAVGEKFDKMQKNGMINMDQMAQLLRDLYTGR